LESVRPFETCDDDPSERDPIESQQQSNRWIMNCGTYWLLQLPPIILNKMIDDDDDYNCWNLSN
jgi:hypothetical protein